MPGKRKFRIGPGLIISAMVVLVLVLLFLTGHLKVVFQVLFSAYAAFLVILLVFEYLLIKGADRSAIYLRELEAARTKRRDDLLALQEIEARLVQLRNHQKTNMAAKDRDPDTGELREDLRLLEEALRLLRERI